MANGVAVLHPQRFLAQYGFDQVDTSMEANGLKNQTVGLLQAVSYLKGKISPITIYYLESVCILLIILFSFM